MGTEAQGRPLDLSAAEILLEDEYLLILNKPAGLHSVMLPQQGNPSVAEWLLRYCPTLRDAAIKPEDAGLVNRLDHQTSGCLLAAKNRKIWGLLRELLHEARIQKSYLTLLDGRAPDIQTVETYIGSPNRRAHKVRVYASPPRRGVRALSALSELTLLHYDPEMNCSLVEVRAASARRHQIRAHAAWIGHALIGDELYGSDRCLAEISGNFSEAPPFLLHAAEIAFEHPQLDSRVSCSAPCPAYMPKRFACRT